MTETTMHQTPRMATVMREQLLAVGIAVRWEALALAVAVGIPTTLALVITRAGGGALPYGSVDDLVILGWLSGLAAFLAPRAVWKGDRSFGDSPVWLLPVGHRRQALMKVAAGGTWLLTALGAVMLWLLLLAVLSGGSIGVVETRNVMDPSAAVGYRAVTMPPPLWQWFAPFTGAVAVYMVASALHLGTRRPWRWIAGAVFLATVLTMLAPGSEVGWFEDAWTNARHHLTVGPYGYDALLAGGVESLEDIYRPPADLVGTNVWTELPRVGRWVGATVLWLGIGSAALFAAASRHRQN